MRFPKRASFCFLAGTVLLGLLVWPATTRQGINFEVTEKRIPLVIKGMDFLVRNYEYRRLAAEVTRGLGTEEFRVEALFRWTREHIRPVPSGWPVVDDHISHILIRGYGTEDQMADVFTTLAAYAGIPAFWRAFGDPEDSPRVRGVLSFVRIGGRWTVWNVATGAVSRDTGNRLIPVEELAKDPGWSRLALFSAPKVLRADEQMPLPRMLQELRSAGRRLLRRPPRNG